MNLSVNTQQLAKKLRLVEKIVAQKNILPVLFNALLQTDGHDLRLSTTNTEISIATSCAAVITAPGAITLPVKPLLDIVSQISDEHTHITLEKNGVRIAAGAFKMRLQTLPAEDFPTLPAVPEGGTLLPGDLFRTMMRKTRSAISDADKRYFMNGALFSLTEHAMAIITTDGKRLALTTAQRPTAGNALQVIIPTKTIDVLLSSDNTEDVLFAQGERHLFFVTDDSVLSSRMVDGNFPNYQRIIPRENTHVMTISRLALLAALKRVSLAADETRIITLLIEPQALSLTSSSVLVGDAVEHLPVTYDGPSFKIALEWTGLHEFLTSSVNQNITLALKDASTAVLLTDGTDYLNVIMLRRA